jgi:hypothetical protein
MIAQQARPKRLRIQHALEELKGLILEHYPEAQFSIGRAADDASIVHLYVTVDIEDLEEVLDVVMDRTSEMLIDEGLPIFVIPLSPFERAIEIYREQQREGDERERARALGAS